MVWFGYLSSETALLPPGAEGILCVKVCSDSFRSLCLVDTEAFLFPHRNPFLCQKLWNNVPPPSDFPCYSPLQLGFTTVWNKPDFCHGFWILEGIKQLFVASLILCFAEQWREIHKNVNTLIIYSAQTCCTLYSSAKHQKRFQYNRSQWLFWTPLTSIVCNWTLLNIWSLNF